MNIVINTLTLGRGGTERVIANLCNDFLVAKHNITIITCAYQDSSYKLDKRIDVRSLDKKTEEIYQNKIKRFIRRRKELIKNIKEINPDIIISFLPEPNFILLSLRNFINIPLIISVRNDPKIEYSFLPYNMMMKKLYPKADGYIFQTEEAKKYFRFNEKIITKSVVIPNPINTSFVRKTYEGIREKVIVSVGRFDEQKNQKLLISAFSKICHVYPDYDLIIYGEGKLREELQKYIKSLNLENRIFLPGQKNNIKEFIYKASIFILTSNYEGMPNSLMEAMALGLPVISTDCPSGGPRLLIQDGVNGILTKVGCEDELVGAITRILSDKKYAKNLGKEANKISITLEPKKIYKMWSDYIESIYSSYKVKVKSEL